MRFVSFAVWLMLAFATPLHATSIPPGGQLAFDVIRKGKDIGDHSYRFSGSGNGLTVSVQTDVDVKVPIIRATAYKFHHKSVETWEDGQLRSIKSATDDDGTPHELATAGKGLLPASLWNDQTIHSSQLLNTIEGNVMRVSVRDLGTEQVTTGKGTVRAHHYRLSGDLNRDLWYDDDGRLAHVSFAADDGSTVTYIRK